MSCRSSSSAMETASSCRLTWLPQSARSSTVSDIRGSRRMWRSRTRSPSRFSRTCPEGSKRYQVATVTGRPSLPRVAITPGFGRARKSATEAGSGVAMVGIVGNGVGRIPTAAVTEGLGAVTPDLRGRGLDEAQQLLDRPGRRHRPQHELVDALEVPGDPRAERLAR